MASIKNLTAVAASAGALIISAGVTGAPHAFANTTSDPAMNGTYEFHYDGDAHVWDTWTISTDCPQSGQCTQHVTGKVMSRGGGYTAQLADGKWTFSAHVPQGYWCKSTDKYGPATESFTYGTSGVGVNTETADPGFCGGATDTFPFHLKKVA